MIPHHEILGTLIKNMHSGSGLCISLLLRTRRVPGIDWFVIYHIPTLQ